MAVPLPLDDRRSLANQPKMIRLPPKSNKAYIRSATTPMHSAACANQERCFDLPSHEPAECTTLASAYSNSSRERSEIHRADVYRKEKSSRTDTSHLASARQ